MRKALNERLRRKMISGQGMNGFLPSNMCVQPGFEALVGLKPGLLQQWQNATDPLQKRFACMLVVICFFSLHGTCQFELRDCLPTEVPVSQGLPPGQRPFFDPGHDLFRGVP